MIREERNALFLLLGFTVAAGLLYLFILRPALTEATRSSAPGPRTAEESARLADPRPKSARRMVGLAALLRDAVTGSPLQAARATVLDVDDIVDPTVTVDETGLLHVDYLPPAISFGLEVTCDGYRGRTFRQLRADARETVDLGLVTLEPLRALSGVILTATGEPLVDCVVTAFPVDAAEVAWTDPLERAAALAGALMAQPRGTVHSGEEGHFQITDLEPGQYAVYAVQKPHAGVVIPCVDLIWRSPRLTIEMNHGPPARGRVEVAGGGALAAATVVLLEPGAPLATRLSAAYCVTDDTGFFAHHALRPTPHLVFVQGGGCAAAGSGPILFDPREESSITVAAGRELTGVVLDADRLPVRDALVRAVSARPGALPAFARTDEKGGWRLSGLLEGKALVTVTAAGYAVDRSLIEVRAAGGEHRAQLHPVATLAGTVSARGLPVLGAVVFAERPHARAITDAEGRYRLDGLPAGPVTVAAVAPGLALVSRRLEVRLMDENRADFLLEAGGEVKVLVTNPAGLPAQGALVQALLLDETGAVAPVPSRHAVTDGQGLTRLSWLPSDCDIVLLATDGAAAPVRSVPLAATPERGRAGVALTLPAAGRVSGTVTDETGAPLAHARIRALPAGQIEEIDRLLLAGVESQSNAAGQYTLGGLPPGEYLVAAQRSGRRGLLADSVAVAPGTCAAGAQFAMLPAPAVAGVVLAPDGQTVAGALVRLVATGEFGPVYEEYLGITNGAGQFSFPRPPTGSYVLSAEARDTGRIELPFDSIREPIELLLQQTE